MTLRSLRSRRAAALAVALTIIVSSSPAAARVSVADPQLRGDARAVSHGHYQSPASSRGHHHAISALTPVPFEAPVDALALALPYLPEAAAPAEAVAAAPCASPAIDMKVLVLAAQASDFVLLGIRQTLEQLGTPYTVLALAPRPAVDTTDRLAAQLASGCHAFYQGVILTTGNLAYFDGVNWLSAITSTELATLSGYEASFGVRQISWYTFPTADYGFQTATGSTGAPVTASLTPTGAATFSYLNAASPIVLQNSFVYRAQPFDANTTTLLTDASGDSLAAVRSYPSGREGLALTFSSADYSPHLKVIGYGLINWLTKGLFLGERHVYLAPQVDDLLIENSTWPVGTPCSTNLDDPSLPTFRLSGQDLRRALTWQRSKQARPETAAFRLAFAFNGVGATGDFAPDNLTPAVQQHQDEFLWISHTFDHEDLTTMNYTDSLLELQQNDDVARNILGLGSNYSTLNLVTPGISGFNNPEFLRAARDFGITNLVGDTSRTAPFNNPSPNAGSYSQYQPSILIIPRHPVNIFFNTTTPQELTDEYNCIYRSFWGRDLSYAEILNDQSNLVLGWLLVGDVDPIMFHQTNLRAYDGVHSLLGDLFDVTLMKYNATFTLPILTPTMDDAGRRMAARMSYNQSGVVASFTPPTPGNPGSITISVQQAARVPITGLSGICPACETYGGQRIGYIDLAAGQRVTLSLP